MLSAQKMTEIRKRQDEKYREMDAMMAQDRKVFQMANFEITTTNKIERRLRNVTIYLFRCFSQQITLIFFPY